MTAIVQTNLGTPPGGVDGDTIRAAMTKLNANMGVLQTQATLSSGAAITAPGALTSANIGQRFNLNFSAPGTLNMPSAVTCEADEVIYLRNIGTVPVTLAPAAGTTDALAVTVIQPGASFTFDTDAVTGWFVFAGQTGNGSDMKVNGVLTVTGNAVVAGNETVSGTFDAKGAATLEAGATVTGGVSTDTLTATGAVHAADVQATTLETTGKATAASLEVSGTTTLDGAANAKAGLSVSGGATADTLSTSGKATLASAEVTGVAKVDGAATLAGGATVTGGTKTDTLEVTGAATFDANATVKGTLTTQGALAATLGVTFADGTVQTTANSTTQANSTWYTVGTTDAVGSFADGDTALRTSGFTAPFVSVKKSGLVLTRGQHYLLRSDGIHIDFTEPLIAADELDVETKGVYNPSSTYLPGMVPLVPLAGATFIAFSHVVGFAWLMQRGVWLQAGVDYTEDATGFYLVGFAADGVETFSVFNLNAISIANALLAANPVITQGVLQFADGSQQGTAAVGRNRIINGDGRVNQRGGGTPSVGSVGYFVDRWYSWQSGAAGAVSTVAGSPTGGNYIRVTGVAGNTANHLGQRIEATNIADLAGKKVTISGYWIRTLGGQVTLGTYTPTAADSYTTTNGYVAIDTPTLAANVWTKFRYTVTLPASAANGLQIEFGVAGLLAGDYFAIADVQLEAGDNPNPVFERRHITMEIALCQRYYEKSPNYTFWPTNAAAASQDCRQLTPFQTAKRSIPSMAYSAGVVTNCSAVTFQGVNLNSYTVRIVSAAAGQFCLDNITVIADAEL